MGDALKSLPSGQAMISSSCCPSGGAYVSFTNWVNLCFHCFFLTVGTAVVIECWISDLSTVSVCVPSRSEESHSICLYVLRSREPLIPLSIGIGLPQAPTHCWRLCLYGICKVPFLQMVCQFNRIPRLFRSEVPNHQR